MKFKMNLFKADKQEVCNAWMHWHFADKSEEGEQPHKY